MVERHDLTLDQWLEFKRRWFSEPEFVMPKPQPPPCPRCQTPLALVSEQRGGVSRLVLLVCPHCRYQRAADPRQTHRGRREARPI